MLAVHDLEIRVGARLLMENVSFRVSDGDKIGLVGRNGAGKTTLTKVLAGDVLPSGGTVTRSGELGYLPQDPRSGNPEDLARTRILDARGLGQLNLGMTEASLAMGSDDPAVAAKAMKRYAALTEKFEAQGGYAAGVREAVYARSSALATRELQFLPATYGDRAGLVGCAALALDEVLSPAAVDARLRRRAEA